LKPRNQTP